MAIDKCIAVDLDKFIELHDIAKVEINTWKKQGVPDYVTNKKHEAKVTVHLLIEGEVRWEWKRTLKNNTYIDSHVFIQNPGVAVCMNEGNHRRNHACHRFRS